MEDAETRHGSTEIPRRFLTVWKPSLRQDSIVPIEHPRETSAKELTAVIW